MERANENEQAELASRLVQQAPDALIFADKEGTIRMWNTAAETLFGYPESEAIGKNLDIIVPEQFREAHWRGYAAAIAAGDTKYRGQALPTRAQKADGQTIYVELTFAILHDAGGTVLGAAAAARDITERFQQDRADRRRLRELEQELESLRPSA